MRSGERWLAVAAAVTVLAALVVPAAQGADRAAPTLYVADIEQLSSDEQLLFTAFQGIVNREAPHIYFLGIKDGQDFTVDATAALWLRDAVPPELVQQQVAPYDLLQQQQFMQKVRGLVVWDPALAVDTQNLATTIAGQSDLLPVSPDLAGALSQPPYSLPVVTDLRTLRFATRSDVYNWAFANLGPTSQYGLLSWMGGSRNGRLGQHGLRDWVVARRGFAFDVDPESEGLLAQSILDAFPPFTPVYGYPFFEEGLYEYSGQAFAPGEEWGVGEISRSGKYLIPSADSTNLTVHSSFPPQAETPQWDDHAETPDLTKTYVAFLISDGDSMGHNEQFLRTQHWDNPDRFAPDAVPVGISISPWLSVDAPRIYDYYVKGLRPNEVLVSGPSGAGYVYPQLHSDLPGYLALSRERLDFAGLRAVWILDNAYVASPSAVTTKQYADILRPSAIFTDYGGYVVANPPPVSFSDGVPVVHTVWGDSVSTAVARVEASATTFPGRPAFVLVELQTGKMSYGEAKQVMDALGPSYVAARPDRFVGLIKGAYPALASGG